MRRLVPLAAVAVLAGCGGSHAAPRVTITPSRTFVDVPVRITVSGLKPHERVVVRASTKSAGGTALRSRLAVDADVHGVARVPETLLASMAPAGAADGYVDRLQWAGQDVRVAAAGATVHLRWLIKARRVALRFVHHPFVGTFLHAASPRPRPGILLFGGSEGGVSLFQEAELLASRGYPVLALAYFGAPGLPATLSRIPLEYFAAALRWLAAQPGVDPKRLVVDGASRGSEAALLLGVYFPQLVHGVVAMAPGDAVMCSYPACDGPAWTIGGRGIPFQASLADADHPIPVDRIRARVLLVCGGADIVWPSCRMARAIVARRRPRVTTLLEFPDAGHGIGDPTPNVPESFPELEGRDRRANARARVDVWPKLLRFLSG